MNGTDIVTEAEVSATPPLLNETSAGRYRSGYDLPVYGINEGSHFYQLHVVALTIIFSSLICAIVVLVWSFRTHKSRFFSWPQGERVAVYMAFCDGLFNISHSLDHLHYVIQRDHVTPPGLCVFYAMCLVEFMTAQILLVNLVAINAFVLVYRRRSLEFGQSDRCLLLYVYGAPVFLSVGLAAAGQLGPSGAFCHFDMVLANPFVYMACNTVLMLLVFLVNSCLYLLTWVRIRREAAIVIQNVGRSQLLSASHTAAKNCMLFVIAFVVQWWAVGILPLWQNFAPPPFWFVQLCTTFTNLGGCLNLLVYSRIRRRRERRSSFVTAVSKRFSVNRALTEHS